MREYKILFFWLCPTKFKKSLHKILCYFGIHTIKKAAHWSANYMRFDVCCYCDYSRYVQDKPGWLYMSLRKKAQNESRKVLFEKIVIDKDAGEVMDVSYYLDDRNWTRVL